MQEDEAWDWWEEHSPLFADRLDGMPGALASFTALAPNTNSASTSNVSGSSRKRPRGA